MNEWGYEQGRTQMRPRSTQPVSIPDFSEKIGDLRSYGRVKSQKALAYDIGIHTKEGVANDSLMSRYIRNNIIPSKYFATLCSQTDIPENVFKSNIGEFTIYTSTAFNPEWKKIESSAFDITEKGIFEITTGTTLGVRLPGTQTKASNRFRIGDTFQIGIDLTACWSAAGFSTDGLNNPKEETFIYLFQIDNTCKLLFPRENVGNNSVCMNVSRNIDGSVDKFSISIPKSGLFEFEEPKGSARFVLLLSRKGWPGKMVDKIDSSKDDVNEVIRGHIASTVARYSGDAAAFIYNYDLI